MAAADARAAWQRMPANRAVQEDAVKTSKTAHRSSLKAQDSYYLDNSWGSMDTKVDFPRKLNANTYCDYRPEHLEVDDVVSRFKPRLLERGAEWNNSKFGSPGYMLQVGIGGDLGWQLLSDSKPRVDCGSEYTVLDEKLEWDVIAASLVDTASETAAIDDDETNALSIMAHEILTKSIKEFSEPSSISSLEAEERPTQLGSESNCTKKKVDSLEIERSSEYLLTSTKSSADSPSRTGISWRSSDREALAALIAQKSSAKLENCDLPAPRSGLKSTTPLDIPKILKEGPLKVSKSFDFESFKSILQDGEFSRVESMGLKISSPVHNRPDPSPSSFCPATTELLNLSVDPNLSPHCRLSKTNRADNRNTRWSEDETPVGITPSKRTNPMVEALCHSQTRAREAEQKVEQAARENQKLSLLLFREASLSLKYRHWISALQADNAWLKMCVQNHHGAIWRKSSFPSTSAVSEQLPKRPRKLIKKRNIYRQMLKHFSAIWRRRDSSATVGDGRDDGISGTLLGYTIGLAIALGITLAGAGFIWGYMDNIILPS